MRACVRIWAVLDSNSPLNDTRRPRQQAGENGAMQSDLTKKFSIDARTIHYNVRHLQGEWPPPGVVCALT